MLTLSRPLVFFDLETTGVDVYNDRIVQLGIIKLLLDGSRTEHEFLINPGIRIPKGASAVHGISDEDVKDAPALGDLAKELSEIFEGADLGGYNVKNFDIPMLREEFNRIGLTVDTEQIRIVDAMKIFQINEPRTLAAAHIKFCGSEMADAHDAMADTRASLAVLEGQMKHYDHLPATVDEIHEYCFPKDPDAYDAEGKLRFIDGQLTINFGKNRGKQLQALALEDPRYLEWILGGSFSEKVKDAVRNVLKS